MNNNIESELKQFLLSNIIYTDGEFPISDDASLLGAGIIDSLGVHEMIEFVGRQYGIEVPIADITPDNFDSVARVGTYVRRKLAEAPAASRQPQPSTPLKPQNL
jgi:acyl carrier protein